MTARTEDEPRVLVFIDILGFEAITRATERLTEYTAGHSFAYELTVRTGVTHRRRSNATTAQA